MEMAGRFFNGGLLPNSLESRLKILVSERTLDPFLMCLWGATPTKSLPGACGVFLTRPISMFRMKIVELFEPCSTLCNNGPCKPVCDAKLNIAPGKTWYIEVMIKFSTNSNLNRLIDTSILELMLPVGRGLFFVRT